MEYLYIFSVGAVGYSLLEILWRGYTHFSMTITGGICFLLIYLLNNHLPIGNGWKILLSAVIITLIEFLVGLLVNRVLGWNVWDYSNRPFHLLGQICLPFSLLWFALSIPLLPLTRILKELLS